jgi:dihydrofolate reductase
MTISVILTIDSDEGVTGMGEISWTIPQNSVKFKKLTENSTVIMGRKTWDSLCVRPMINRNNIVLSRSKALSMSNRENYKERIMICPDFSLKSVRMIEKLYSNVFVIGGKSTFEKVISWGIVDKVYLCKLGKNYNCAGRIDLFRLGLYFDYVIDEIEFKKFQNSGIEFLEFTKLS